MTSTNDGLRQATVRAVTGTTLDYDGDWHALFTAAGIAAGTYDERMLAWINSSLSTSYTSLPQAMQALAVANGAYNFSSMGTFAASSEFTPIAGTTNWLKANVPNALAAMTTFKASGGDFIINVDGDSVVAGQGANGVIGSNVAGSRNNMKAFAWPTQLVALLNAASIPASRPGFHGDNSATSYAELLTSDTRMSNGGTGTGWTQGPFPSVGGNVLRNTADTTQTFIYTCPDVSDHAIIDVMSYSGAGTIAYSLDGGAETTVNLDNVTRFLRSIVVAFGSNAANHTVTWRNSASGIFPDGVSFYSSVNRRVLVHNHGSCGAISDAAVDVSQGESWGNNLALNGAKLALNCFGLNDQGARADPTLSGISISTWIDTVRAASCDPILVFPQSRSVAPAAVQAAYLAKWQAVANAKNCPLVDMTYFYPTLTEWQAASFDSGDGLHPNTAGAGNWAARVYALLAAIYAAA